MAAKKVTVIIPADVSGGTRERATDREIFVHEGQQAVFYYRRILAIEPYPADSRFYGWYRATRVLR